MSSRGCVRQMTEYYARYVGRRVPRLAVAPSLPLFLKQPQDSQDFLYVRGAGKSLHQSANGVVGERTGPPGETPFFVPVLAHSPGNRKGFNVKTRIIKLFQLMHLRGGCARGHTFEQFFTRFAGRQPLEYAHDPELRSFVLP